MGPVQFSLAGHYSLLNVMSNDSGVRSDETSFALELEKSRSRTPQSRHSNDVWATVMERDFP